METFPNNQNKETESPQSKKLDCFLEALSKIKKMDEEYVKLQLTNMELMQQIRKIRIEINQALEEMKHYNEDIADCLTKTFVESERAFEKIYKLIEKLRYKPYCKNTTTKLFNLISQYRPDSLHIENLDKKNLMNKLRENYQLYDFYKRLIEHETDKTAILKCLVYETKFQKMLHQLN